MKKNIILLLIPFSFSFSNGISFINKPNNNGQTNLIKNDLKQKNDNLITKNQKKIKILKQAQKLMGKPYVWGANVGDYNHFDCSSFVKTLYKEVGINLPRVSKQQSNIGKKIPLEKLQPGDLIFFNTLGDYVSHVGIYIGNNKFIHASSKAKKTVVSEFSGYYRKKAVFGTRVI